MNASDALLRSSLEANWGTQLQLAWTLAFLKNLDLRAARTLAIQLRFIYSPQQALDELHLFLPLIDQTYPDGSFELFLQEVVAADQALAQDN